MEKRVFNNVMNFLTSYKEKTIEITWNSYGGDLEWDWPWTSMIGKKIPSNIMNVIISIVDKYLNELLKNAYSENEAFRVNAMIYPFDKKIVLGIEQEENKENGTFWETELTPDDRLYQIIKDKNIEVIYAPYNGGGDSGYIDNVTITTEDGEKINDENNEIESLLYDDLNSIFGGWELDDGSSGEISVEGNFIEINHTWYTREFRDSGFYIELTSEDFEN